MIDCSSGPVIDRMPGHTRAFVKVQDGCDARCAFCIVPNLRPEPRSRPIADILREAAALVANGYREVVLSGIFLGAFGRSTAIRRNWDPSDAEPLVELVDAVSRVPGLERVRLSSLEPGDLSDAALELLANRTNLLGHLHLPLQSGSETILRGMNRQYTAEQFLHTVERVGDRLDRPAVTTDVIVGFPGETDADFDATMDLARRAGFAGIHVFRFSPRPGTAAARRKDQFLPPDVIRRRAGQLAQLADRLSADYRRQFIGQNMQVIIERPGASGSVRRGQSDRNFAIHFALPDPPPGPLRDRPLPVDDPAGLAGRLATVRVERLAGKRTIGRLISIDD